MYSYVLQDWTSVSVDAALADIKQSETDWLSFQPYQDIVLWLEVKAFEDGGAGAPPNIFYDTAPTKDESFFKPMLTNGVSMTTGLHVTPIVLSAGPDTPLSRWVRWRLAPPSTPSSNYGATFRIFCSANAVGVIG